MKILKKKGFTLVEIMIVVAIIGIIIAIAVPAFLRARENARGRACQENLQKIDGAKEQYALEHRLSNGATIPNGLADLAAYTLYIKRTPQCPAGGGYTVEPIGTDPWCSIAGAQTTPANTYEGYVDHDIDGVDDVY
jgi:prepilin-type N-terminal cleavage/methylation domain-containing protein